MPEQLATPLGTTLNAHLITTFSMSGLVARLPNYWSPGFFQTCDDDDDEDAANDDDDDGDDDDDVPCNQ